jgi:hypothetical protein
MSISLMLYGGILTHVQYKIIQDVTNSNSIKTNKILKLLLAQNVIPKGDKILSQSHIHLFFIF